MMLRRHFFAAAAGTLLGPLGTPKMFGNAEAYERFMGRWSRLLAPLLIDFAGIPEGKILDVGSGTGTLTFAIAERKTHCQITGIDPSEEYIRYAISRSPFPDRTTFEVGDA